MWALVPAFEEHAILNACINVFRRARRCKVQIRVVTSISSVNGQFLNKRSSPHSGHAMPDNLFFGETL
jgi:hypothetical protein